MSGSNMDSGMKELLGITNLMGESMGEINPADLDEFGEFKKEPRPEVVFEMDEKETRVPDLNQSDAKTDYAFARSMNYTLLRMTTKALAKALAVADDTEHPRAFESFNSLAATARGLTQDLVNLQKIYKEVTKGRPEMEPAATVPQTTSNDTPKTPSGTTTDIMQLLQESIDNGTIRPMQMNDGIESEDDEDEETKVE